jgi:hypothetical protein
MAEYSEEDLAGLSDEERKAVLEPDEPEVDDPEVDEPDEDDPEVDEPDEPDEPDKPEVVEDEPEPEPEVEKPKPEKVIEKLVVKLPDELAEAFTAQLTDLQKQYDDGEIELSDLLNQRDKINRAIYNAEVEATEQANAKSAWESAQDVFLAGNPIYTTDTARLTDFNLCVKAIGNKGNFNTFEEALAKAKKMEEAMNGKSTPKEEVKPEPKAKAKSPRPKVPAISELPTSKANDDGGEFASLDSLTGIEYENALAKLTPAQLDRYLK